MSTDFYFEYLNKLTDNQLIELINSCLIEYDIKEGNNTEELGIDQKLGIGDHDDLGKVLDIRVENADGSKDSFRINDFGLINEADGFHHSSDLQHYMILKFGEDYIKHHQIKLNQEVKKIIGKHIEFLTDIPDRVKESIKTAESFTLKPQQP